MRTEPRGRAAACVALAAAAWLVCPPRVVHAQQGATTTLVVSATGAVRTVSEALRLAPAGGRITVKAGTYAEPLLRVTRPVTLEGEPGAVLDGGGTHTILEVVADDVTVRGLTLRNTGPSQSEERAGILVHDVRGCRIEGNRLEQTLFAIYLAKVTDCLVQRNVVRGPESAQMVSGNGIHVWSSQRVQLVANDVRGHRDGIYFEFVTEGDVVDNTSAKSARYGMHFMFSDDCRYERNTFLRNNNGVAVMYSRRIAMVGNRFEENWGSAAYGLLLKDINDSRIEDNQFLGNSVGLHLEGSNRNRVTGNTFRGNGWALKTLANAQDNRYERNIFESNAFDVGTNSRSNVSTFGENYWDRYRGYDLDRDGIGDVPHAPVRLFALVVEQTPATLILLRSLLVDLLDLAERVIPALTPETLLDERPLMKRPAQDGLHG
jgi:nitrous oxidase accessory protein